MTKHFRLFTLCLFFFSYFNVAQAGTQYIPDSSLLPFNCSGNNVCLGTFTIKDTVWMIGVPDCQASQCTSYSPNTFYYSTDPSTLANLFFNKYVETTTYQNPNKKNFNLYCHYNSVALPNDYYSCGIDYDTYDYSYEPARIYHEVQPAVFGVSSVSHPRSCPNNATYVSGVGCAVTGNYTDSNGNKYVTERTTGFANSNCPFCQMLEASRSVKALLPPTHLTDEGVGEPVSIAAKAVVEHRVDLTYPILLSRNYSSKRNVVGQLGNGWKNNFEKTLSIVSGTDAQGSFPVSVTFLDEKDNEVVFTRIDRNSGFSLLYSDQIGYLLTIENGNYIVKTPEGNKHIYNGNGYLSQTLLRNGSYYNFSYYNNVETITNNYGQSLTLTYNGNLLTQAVSSSGDTVSYSYDGNNLKKVTFNSIETEEYSYSVFNNTSKIVSIKDELGNVSSTFNYDANGLPIQNARKLGTKNIEEYNFSLTDSYSSYSQPNGNGVTYNISSYLSTNKIKNYSGSTDGRYSLDYDSFGNISTYVDANSNRYNYTYDSNNLLSTITRPDNQTVNIYLNVDSRLPSSVSEPSSNGTLTTSYSYDNYDNLISKTISSNSETVNYSYNYTTNGRISSYTDQNGNTVNYSYYQDNDANINLRGLVYSVTNSLNQTVTYNSYDNHGNPTSITGVDGVVKTLTYDTRGRTTSETVNGNTNSYIYDLAGNLKQAVFANGYVLNLVYDTAQRLTNLSDNLGANVSYTLDDNTSMPINETVSHNSYVVSVKNRLFDNLGRLSKSWSSNSSRAKNYNYYGGNLVSATDEDNLTIYSNPNSRNFRNQDLSNTENGIGQNFTYDVAGNMTSFKLNNSQTTSMTYDDLGRITQLTSPDSGISNYSYSIANHTTTKVDAKNITHTLTTDVLGKPVSVVHTDNASTVTENYVYDNIGRITSISNDVSNLEYSYDNLGHLASKTQTVSNVVKGLTYNYNNLEQLSSMTYPSGLVVNYTYDKGQIVIVSTSMGSLISGVKYRAFNGGARTWTWGNNSIMKKTYATNDTLTSLVDSNVFNSTIVQNEMGNIKSIVDNGINNSFNYSNFYSLQSAFGMNYDYDSNLNARYIGQTYVLYHDNKINYLQKGSVTKSYSYDSNGNVLSDDAGNVQNKYVYDLKNNLSQVNLPNQNISYVYNSLNQRVSKTVDGVTTYYVYDEASRLIGEYDASGNVLAEHIYFNGMPIAVLENGQLYYVHSDHIGTPRAVTTTAGNVVWKWDNADAYGGNLPSISTIQYNLRFSGQYFDNETKLHYNIHRTYNPETGKYLQPDPIGLAGGQNTYNYVNGNMLNSTDPMGLDINRIQYPLDVSKNNLDVLDKSLAFVSNNTFMPIEEYIKNNWTDDNHDILTIGGHGSETSLSHFSSEEISNMIISGIFDMRQGKYRKNNFFKDKIKSNQNITVKLEACDTGITIITGTDKNGKTTYYNFAGDVATRLRNAAKSFNYKGEITVLAPNGLSIFWWNGHETVTRDSHGLYSTEPTSYGYSKY